MRNKNELINIAPNQAAEKLFNKKKEKNRWGGEE
jgi:hypothetical protein